MTRATKTDDNKNCLRSPPSCLTGRNCCLKALATRRKIAVNKLPVKMFTLDKDSVFSFTFRVSVHKST